MRLERLDELTVFCQVVESGSLTRAGQVLGMPVNTVSRRIAALEQRVGRPLLYRTTRSVSLSEAGRTLLVHARRILAEAHSAEAALASETEGLTGLVRVSVPSVLTGDFFAVMEPLLVANPGLHLQVEVHDTWVNPVEAGLDVVVMGGGMADSTLVARKLLDIRFVCVASHAYRESAPPLQTPDSLAHHRTVHFRQDPPQSTWTLVDETGIEHVVPVQARLEVSDGRAVLDAVRAGLGVALLSTRALRHPDIVQVLPDHHAGTTPIYAMYPSSGERSARLRAVVERMRVALDHRAPDRLA